MTSIFDIIKYGNKRLLLKNKNNYDYNILYNNYNPLTYAYSKNMIEILYMMINIGIDINKKDGFNKTIMEYACNDNNIELIYYLKNIDSCNDSWEKIVLILLQKEYYDSIIKLIEDKYINNDYVLQIINLEKISDTIFTKMLILNNLLNIEIFNKLYILELYNKLDIYIITSNITYDLYNKLIVKYINDKNTIIKKFIIECINFLDIFYDNTINIIIKSDDNLYINKLLKKNKYIDKILYYSIINCNQYAIDYSISNNANYISVMNLIIKNKLIIPDCI
jgi:ankyrin repeat protein